MKMTIDLPEDLAAEVQCRAASEGRDLAAEVVELLQRALAVSPAATEPARPLGQAIFSRDPDTALPVIDSLPDAPTRRITAEQAQAFVERVELEEDLERAALAGRREDLERFVSAVSDRAAAGTDRLPE